MLYTHTHIGTSLKVRSVFLKDSLVYGNAWSHIAFTFLDFVLIAFVIFTMRFGQNGARKHQKSLNIFFDGTRQIVYTDLFKTEDKSSEFE